MKKQLSDEQFDQLMRTLVTDASLDDSAINEIADSPSLWWSVQREINLQKDARSPWPPALRRWLMFGVPALAAFALMSIFVFGPTSEKTEQAGVQQNVVSPANETPSPAVTEPALPANNNKGTMVAAVNSVPRTDEHSAIKPSTAGRKRTSPTSRREIETANEIKSDFIALSYARNPESGQIVRVKVPSSMMVTLGLVSSVEKPANLVDAEVVVGDDGMTHAIRFIR